MIRKCKDCAACYAVYGEAAFSYYKTESLFYCVLRKTMTDKESVCDDWRKRGRADVDFSKARFDEVEKDILYIKDNYKYLK